jgi:hypothetical protein
MHLLIVLCIYLLTCAFRFWCLLVSAFHNMLQCSYLLARLIWYWELCISNGGSLWHHLALLLLYKDASFYFPDCSLCIIFFLGVRGWKHLSRGCCTVQSGKSICKRWSIKAEDRKTPWVYYASNFFFFDNEVVVIYITESV